MLKSPVEDGTGGRLREKGLLIGRLLLSVASKRDRKVRMAEDGDGLGWGAAGKVGHEGGVMAV